ncbi:hypothetical protein Ciccas_009536, partial [Cichlidogyrus casuarinus]
KRPGKRLEIVLLLQGIRYGVHYQKLARVQLSAEEKARLTSAEQRRVNFDFDRLLRLSLELSKDDAARAKECKTRLKTLYEEKSVLDEEKDQLLHELTQLTAQLKEAKAAKLQAQKAKEEAYAAAKAKAEDERAAEMKRMQSEARENSLQPVRRILPTVRAGPTLIRSLPANAIIRPLAPRTFAPRLFRPPFPTIVRHAPLPTSRPPPSHSESEEEEEEEDDEYYSSEDEAMLPQLDGIADEEEDVGYDDEDQAKSMKVGQKRPRCSFAGPASVKRKKEEIGRTPKQVTFAAKPLVRLTPARNTDLPFPDEVTPKSARINIRLEKEHEPLHGVNGSDDLFFSAASAREKLGLGPDPELLPSVEEAEEEPKPVLVTNVTNIASMVAAQTAAQQQKENVVSKRSLAKQQQVVQQPASIPQLVHIQPKPRSPFKPIRAQTVTLPQLSQLQVIKQKAVKITLPPLAEIKVDPALQTAIDEAQQHVASQEAILKVAKGKVTASQIMIEITVLAAERHESRRPNVLNRSHNFHECRIRGTRALL